MMARDAFVKDEALYRDLLLKAVECRLKLDDQRKNDGSGQEITRSEDLPGNIQ